MNVEQFGQFKTGRLEPINPEGRFHDYAFIPDRLPPRWSMDSSLWPLVVEARDRVASLNGAGGILPNPALLLRPLQRKEAIKSNSIEGTFVTPEELLLFEAERNQDRDPSASNVNDWREVLLYDKALSDGCSRIEQGHKLDRTLMCDLHRSLLQTVRGKDKNPGIFRDTQVYVEAGRRYIPPPPEHINELITDLEAFHEQSDIDPLVRAFIAHYQFEAIHPYKDGNGRLGRLILSLSIYKWLNHSHAWLYLSDFFDKNRREYINRLLAISTSGEWDEWIKFCLLGAIQQAEVAICTCKKLDAIKKQYYDELGPLSSRMNAIISRLLTDPLLRINRLAKELGVSYNTAASDVQKLADRGILVELPNLRPKAYVAQAIFSAAYDAS